MKPTFSNTKNVFINSSFSIPDNSISFVARGTPNTYSSNITTSISSVLAQDGCVPTLGAIDEIKAGLAVIVYPNSSTGVFNFKVTTQSEITIVILDSKGREITRHESATPKTSIDISNEADGFYYYKIIDETRREARGKLILIK
ncbi:MAG: T9SS type A sorting domain-containing protein [Crocinitomicaceae bacterium]|nr:T9SS type A sorting domain-containing protein [Crocinitomicaceae bacterium]